MAKHDKNLPLSAEVRTTLDTNSAYPHKIDNTVVLRGGIKSKKTAESEFRRQRREGGLKEWGPWLDDQVAKNAISRELAAKWREPNPVSRG